MNAGILVARAPQRRQRRKWQQLLLLDDTKRVEEAGVQIALRVYWGWLESWMLLRSYLAVETRQQAPCKKKTHRENAPELVVHL